MGRREAFGALRRPSRGPATAALLALALLAGPASAQAATATTAVMFSDPGDYIGGGVPRLFHPGNGSVTLNGDAGSANIAVSGGTSGDSFTMEFAAPPGQALAPGFYTGAQRAAFRQAGRPGIDIYGDGRGCNTDAGSFEVKDIHLNGSGVPDRVWIVYEQHCEGGVPALFGEVRVGEGVPDGPAFAPSMVRWPPIDMGRGATTVPVTLLITGADSFGAASVGGPNAGDFQIREDDCKGHSFAAGSTCQVWLRFVSTASGSRGATLTIPDGAGGHDVPLQGFAYGGLTRVTMQSDSGDYIGAGQNWSYTPSNAVITASGTRAHVQFGVSGDGGDWWTADFTPPSGDILAPGQTYNATRYPFNNGGAGMDVSGNGRGCNTLNGQFTVTDASFAPDGSVQFVGIDFTQHCEGAGPALHGSFDYRVGYLPPDNPWAITPAGPQPAPGSAAPPGIAGGPAAGMLTIRAKPTDLFLSQWTKITGLLKERPGGNAGQPVQLQASPFPYKAWVTLASAKTDGSGAYAFKARPALNTRYRVVSGAAVSPKVNVYADFPLVRKWRRVGFHRYRETLEIATPRDIDLSGRAMHFYVVRHHGRVARHIAKSKLRKVKAGLFKTSAVLHLSKLGTPTLSCYRETAPDGFGRPLPIDAACGARVLKAR